MALRKFSLFVSLFLPCLLFVEAHQGHNCRPKENDHLECYRIKGDRKKENLLFNLIGNAYQKEYSSKGCKLLSKGKALEFCVPATKEVYDGEHDPCFGYNDEDCPCKELTDYLCYNMKCENPQHPKREIILDQFDTSKKRVFRIQQVKRICVPAWKLRENALVHVYDPPNCNVPEPTLAPTLPCDILQTCSIYPDPHYIPWSSDSYDYQGACDQLAIDNPFMQLQIRTRPYHGYSTVTQVALVVKGQSPDLRFRVKYDGNGGGYMVTYGPLLTPGVSITPYLGGHKITFSLSSVCPESEIIIRPYNGMNVQVKGTSAVFGHSVGMCGSFDSNGVYFKNGTIFDTSGGWSATRERSQPLAMSWQIPFTENRLESPSTICVDDRNCVTSPDFPCYSSRRLQDQSECDRTCDDITGDPTGISKSACEEDEKIVGNNLFACNPAYIDPIIISNKETRKPRGTPTVKPVLIQFPDDSVKELEKINTFTP